MLNTVRFVVIAVAWRKLLANAVPVLFYNVKVSVPAAAVGSPTTHCHKHASATVACCTIGTPFYVSQLECFQTCAQTQDCDGAVYRNSDGYCLLKSSVGGRDHSLTTMVLSMNPDPCRGDVEASITPPAVPGVCFLYADSQGDIQQGIAQRAGPLKFNETVLKQFANATNRVYVDIIAASGQLCPSIGPSLLGAVGFVNLSKKHINIIGYGPGIQSSATLLAPRDRVNGTLTQPAFDQMTLITANYAEGFTSCSGTMMEGSVLVTTFGPYTVGLGASARSRLPVSQLVFTWTCDGIVVGTLTRPRQSFCADTVFLATVVGKKGGTGGTGPFVKMIQGRTCPTPSSITTTTGLTSLSTSLSMKSSSLSTSSFSSSSTRGNAGKSYFGVSGGAVRVFAHGFVFCVSLFVTGHMLC